MTTATNPDVAAVRPEEREKAADECAGTPNQQKLEMV
jgi:hypothetical protein